MEREGSAGCLGQGDTGSCRRVNAKNSPMPLFSEGGRKAPAKDVSRPDTPWPSGRQLSGRPSPHWNRTLRTLETLASLAGAAGSCEASASGEGEGAREPGHLPMSLSSLWRSRVTFSSAVRSATPTGTSEEPCALRLALKLGLAEWPSAVADPWRPWWGGNALWSRWGWWAVVMAVRPALRGQPREKNAGGLTTKCSIGGLDDSDTGAPGLEQRVQRRGGQIGLTPVCDLACR